MRKRSRTKVNTGPKLLRRWRAANGVSQADVAARLVPAITQPAVTRWERADVERPSLAAAVQIERMTGGAVPATSWGYPRTDVDAILGTASQEAA